MLWRSAGKISGRGEHFTGEMFEGMSGKDLSAVSRMTSVYVSRLRFGPHTHTTHAVSFLPAVL